MSTTPTTPTARPPGWDEPAGAASPRGWLHRADGECVGFYLDYQAGHSRPGHTTEIYPGTTVSFCKPDDPCRDCQPGNVLAVRYPNGPSTKPRDSRWAETVELAREFVESGAFALAGAGTPVKLGCGCDDYGTGCQAPALHTPTEVETPDVP
jgi:hypothetical protein